MVKLREPRHVVEGAVFRHLLENVLTPDIIADITARVVELAREEASAPAGEVSVESLEAELATLRGEQKRVARLLAKLDDAPELEQEYQTRTGQIRQLETDIAAAKAAPRAVELAVEAIASHVGLTFERLRKGLVGAPEAAREALRALFPRGLRFAPDASGRGWNVTGAPVVDLGGNKDGDPRGI